MPLTYDSKYLGQEKNPYLRLRVGKILKVYYINTDPNSDKVRNNLGKVDIVWLDWGGKTLSPISITYPSYSNPAIIKDGNKITKGSSYGFLHMPSEGDLVLCGYTLGNEPIIIGYMPHNFYQQTLDNSNKEDYWGDFRLLQPGEYSLKSKQQAEIYLDHKGNIQFVGKVQPLPVSPATISTDIPSESLVKLTLGTSYTDDTFATKDTSLCNSANNVNVNLKVTNDDGVNYTYLQIDNKLNILIGNAARNIKFDAENDAVEINHTTGAKISIDSEGNIEVIAASGKEINLHNGTAGTKGVVRLDDAVKSTSTEDSAWWLFMTTLNTWLSTHTHPTAATGAPSAPLVGPPSSPSSLTSKVTESSDSVKAGD